MRRYQNRFLVYSFYSEFLQVFHARSIESRLVRLPAEIPDFWELNEWVLWWFNGLILSLDKHIDLLNDTPTPLLLISFLRCTSIDQFHWEGGESALFLSLLSQTVNSDSPNWIPATVYSGMSKQSVNIGKGGKFWQMCNWKIDGLDHFRCKSPSIHCIRSSVIRQAFRCLKGAIADKHNVQIPPCTLHGAGASFYITRMSSGTLSSSIAVILTSVRKVSVVVNPAQPSPAVEIDNRHVSPSICNL